MTSIAVHDLIYRKQFHQKKKSFNQTQKSEWTQWAELKSTRAQSINSEPHCNIKSRPVTEIFVLESIYISLAECLSQPSLAPPISSRLHFRLPAIFRHYLFSKFYTLLPVNCFTLLLATLSRFSFNAKDSIKNLSPLATNTRATALKFYISSSIFLGERQFFPFRPASNLIHSLLFTENR